jgi:hypothetical protein
VKRKKRLTSCRLCGAPQYAGGLVRTTWEAGYGVMARRMIVPRYAGPDDILLCMNCIRQIKRLPFSDLERSPPVPNCFPIGRDGTYENPTTDLPF